MEVLYASPKSVAGIRTPAVTGRFDRAEALKRLLEGTGFTYEFDTDASVLIARRNDPAPETAKGSDSGREFTVALAPPPTAPAPLSEVTVTGSYLHGVLDMISPVRMMSQAEMRGAPYATVQDALQMVPGNMLSTQSDTFGGVGNFNRGSAPNLRGLGYGATLVLVDGYRQPAAGTSGDFVDVSEIPWSAVDHIEVLPDGASALYGSDAIAGVINIIMRDHLDGVDTQLRAATTPAGAMETMAAQLFGKQWDSGHLFMAYQYTHRSALAAADRAYTANADKTPFGGSDFRTLKSNPGNILDPSSFEPTFAIPRGQDGSSLESSDLVEGAPNRQNQFETFDLSPDRRMHSFLLSATQQIGEDAELFFKGRYTQRNTTYRIFSDEEVLDVKDVNPYFVAPPGSGDSEEVWVAYNFLDDLGPVTNSGRTRNATGVAGIRGTLLRDWHGIFSASFGSEDLRYVARNLVNLSALQDALDDPDPDTAFNPFGDGSYTNPETLANLRTAQQEHSSSSVMTLQVIADGTVFELPAGPAKLAVGAEHRREELSNLSAVPQGFERSVSAAFAELALPIAGDSGNPHATPRIVLSLSARYEQYSDFGHTFNPKAALNVAPLNWLKLRGTWGTSFKAPKLVDLYNTSNNGSTLLVLPDPRVDSNFSLVGVIQGANPALREETATTWTAGLDLSPVQLPGFAASLTYFRISYENQVIQPGPPSPFDILSQEALWTTVVKRSPSPDDIAALCARADFDSAIGDCLRSSPSAIVDISLRNLASVQASGLDVSLNQEVATPLGRIHLGLEATRTLEFNRKFSPSAPSISILNTIGNPNAIRLRAAAEWAQRDGAQSGFGARLNMNYLGKSSDPDATGRQVPPWATFDAQLRYGTSATEGALGDVTFIMNVANVTNREPPFVNRDIGFDLLNAVPYGRVVSLMVDKRW